MNSVERTVLFANLTSDTTNGAVRNYILTHILGGTLYFHFLLSGQQFDDVFGASGNAFAAGNTFIFINYCNTVNDFDLAKSLRAQGAAGVFSDIPVQMAQALGVKLTAFAQ